VLGLFLISMIVSGLSALPLQRELSIICKLFGISDPSAYVDMQGLR
jgi:hypothetical protein